MIRRPPHGATRRPPLARPGNGYGRPLRPGPPAQWRDPAALATFRSWDPVEVFLAQVTAAGTAGDAAVTA